MPTAARPPPATRRPPRPSAVITVIISSSRSSPHRPIRRPRGRAARHHPALGPGLRGHQQRLVVTPIGTRTRRRRQQEPGVAQAALAAGAQERLDVGEVARVGLDDGGDDVADDGDQLGEEVGGGPGEQDEGQVRGQAAVDAADRGAHEAQRLQQGDDVADERDETPQGGGAELQVQAAEAAAVAVDEPLVAVGLAAQGLEDACVAGAEARREGALGLLATARREDVDVVFGVLWIRGGGEGDLACMYIPMFWW